MTAEIWWWVRWLWPLLIGVTGFVCYCAGIWHGFLGEDYARGAFLLLVGHFAMEGAEKRMQAKLDREASRD